MAPLTADAPLVVNGHAYISTREAAALAGWSARYIQRLCTSGELASLRLKSMLLVEKQPLLTFIADTQVRKQELRAALRTTRLREYAMHQGRALTA